MAAAAARRVARHLRHAPYVDTGCRQGVPGADAAVESFLECGVCGHRARSRDAAALVAGPHRDADLRLHRPSADRALLEGADRDPAAAAADGCRVLRRG